MIVKPAIQWLNKNSDPILASNVATVLQAMADNVALYPSPTPPLAEVQTALDNFKDALAGMLDGGRSTTIVKKDLRRVLVGLVRQLAAYVTVACDGKLDNLILSGFPPQNPVRTRVGKLAQPQGLTVKHGAHLGELVARINPVFGAAIYNYRLTANTPGAVPVVVQDTASFHTFSGLTAGVKYTIEVSASGTAGQSDWSGSASLTPIKLKQPATPNAKSVFQKLFQT
jgi:hypothetical protein